MFLLLRVELTRSGLLLVALALEGEVFYTTPIVTVSLN